LRPSSRKVIEVCIIHYGPDGELQTWPKEREKVRDMALRYSQLNQALRRKKSVNLSEFPNEKKHKGLENLNKKRKTTSDLEKKPVDVLKYPMSDHYSPHQISKLIQSLELNVSKVQERLRFVESQKLQSLASSSLNYHNLQTTQSMNPKPQLKNQLMKQELCDYDHNISISDMHITNNSFPHPCVTNKESVNNFGSINQLMQKDYFYGADQNMPSMCNFNSNSFQHPCVSNTQHY
ncbi:hypothetical protein CARUB_v10006350mg, partial [Capsella rubella]